MKIILTLVTFILLFISCNKSKVEKRLFIITNKDATWYEEDSATEKLKNKFKKDYVENFTVNNTSFRFQKAKSILDKYELLCFKNDNWSTNLNLPMPSGKDKFYMTNDFDLDKSFDLSYLEYENIVIYFFDNDKKMFNPNPMKFSYDYALLDSGRLIYGTNRQRYNTYNIDIFSIANHSIYHFLYIKILNIPNNKTGISEFTNAQIYKCNSGVFSDTSLIETLHINEKYGEFSLNKFMKTMAKTRVLR